MEKVEKILSLITKHRDLTLSQEEDNELQDWLAESEENRSLFAELTDHMAVADKLKAYAQINSEAVWEKTLQQIDPSAKVVPLYPVQRARWKYPAAAVVVLALSVAGWLYFKPAVDQPVVEIQPASGSTDEIVPGSAKATLTLIDGSKKGLDNTTAQQKIEQGNIIISKGSGQIAYNSANGASENDPAVGSTVLYNTVSTPRGGQFQVILPDGSIVWLNAASSLRFPIAFAGGERNVSLTGEAFFEVAPMANKPFKVTIGSPLGNGGTVEVLGTRFNINAYADDAVVKTTLLHGSVKLTTQSAVQQVLRPGQEAFVDRGGKVEKVSEVDITTAVSWRNSKLNLEGDVKTVMQEIGRWYDLKIEYGGKIPVKSLKGQIPRNYPIADLISLLKSQGIDAALNRKDRKIVII
jgi:transmembrane sensor